MARVEIEDDGLPAQLAPRNRRPGPDDPSQPWSPNYGRGGEPEKPRASAAAVAGQKASIAEPGSADTAASLAAVVADDGKGFVIAESMYVPGHLGLVAIRERAQLAGGKCRIESEPGAGARV